MQVILTPRIGMRSEDGVLFTKYCIYSEQTYILYCCKMFMWVVWCNSVFGFDSGKQQQMRAFETKRKICKIIGAFFIPTILHFK